MSQLQVSKSQSQEDDKMRIVVKPHNFDEDFIAKDLPDYTFAKRLSPIVYLLESKELKEAYIGETTDVISRFGVHLDNDDKQRLSGVYLFWSRSFNKSATLDLEANLIKYMAADGNYRLLNASPGLTNHNYYNRLVYEKRFEVLWLELIQMGIAINSLKVIANRDIFKYSPYKALDRGQKSSLVKIMKAMLDESCKFIVMEGGAGTGKTVLAMFLLKLLNTDARNFSYRSLEEDKDIELINLAIELRKQYVDKKMALVIPMGSFRVTMTNVFDQVDGLNKGMVLAPADIAKQRYDFVIVDEAHRLRRRVNLGRYYKKFDSTCVDLGMDKYIATELKWVEKQSSKAVFFYDANQSIKPSDVLGGDFDALKEQPQTISDRLWSQFRVRGGDNYIKFIDEVFAGINSRVYQSKKYELLLFDRVKDMEKQIRLREEEFGLSRMAAGYAWQWKSKLKENKHLIDIVIEDGTVASEYRWNGVLEDWINSENSINEIGCIHTTQGYDLNYLGVIFGNEIAYDEQKKQIAIDGTKYHDLSGKNTLKKHPEKLKAFIINIYKTLMLRGIHGTYIYVCDPGLKSYLAQYIKSYRPLLSSSQITDKVSVAPDEDNSILRNKIPLYDLRAAAGSFSDFQKPENIIRWLDPPSDIKKNDDLFAIEVIGESMNEVIPNGSICLFRKYSGGSRNDKIVLVQYAETIDQDFGSMYTVKKYHSKKITTTDGSWQHDVITLLPQSRDSKYKTIELKFPDGSDESSYFKIIAIFDRILE